MPRPVGAPQAARVIDDTGVGLHVHDNAPDADKHLLAAVRG